MNNYRYSLFEHKLSDVLLSSVVMQRHLKAVAKYHSVGNSFTLLKILQLLLCDLGRGNSPVRWFVTALLTNSNLSGINGVFKILSGSPFWSDTLQMENPALKIKGHMKLPCEISKVLKVCANVFLGSFNAL